MNIFETSGQAQMLLGEGNRQFVLALAADIRRGLQRLTRILAGSHVKLSKSAGGFKFRSEHPRFDRID